MVPLGYSSWAGRASGGTLSIVHLYDSGAQRWCTRFIGNYGLEPDNHYRIERSSAIVRLGAPRDARLEGHRRIELLFVLDVASPEPPLLCLSLCSRGSNAA